MTRDYQKDFSSHSGQMFDESSRRRKADTIIAVLESLLGPSLSSCRLLDVGCSTGIIDDSLSGKLGFVAGADIDTRAVIFASRRFSRHGLSFLAGDATSLAFMDSSFDVVVCSQVYEHVHDAKTMVEEIRRVLKPGGVCYFAAGNRIRLIEPHYGLPFLSVLPRPVAHVFIRLSGKADHYHELHLSYWALRRLVRDFELIDFTEALISSPERFHTGYMVGSGRIRFALAKSICRHAIWLMPGYVWILRKPVPVD